MTPFAYEQGWFASSIVNAVLWIGNLLISIINLAINVIWMFVNLMSLMMLMIGLFGYLFVIFLPNVLTSVGAIGYILTLGYVFIICVLGYKYGHVILELVSVIMKLL